LSVAPGPDEPYNVMDDTPDFERFDNFDQTVSYQHHLFRDADFKMLLTKDDIIRQERDSLPASHWRAKSKSDGKVFGRLYDGAIK